jgi:AraC-like DNA-binding protein
MLTTPATRLLNLAGATPDHAEPAKIWKARSYIQEHLEEELSLTQVAKAVNISPNHLSEKFKQVTGVNFVTYVARARYEKALSLLHDTDFRVTEIAFATGFQSLSQFNRVFKKLSGRSPTAYRASTRAKTACRHTRALRASAQNRSSILPRR